MKIIVFTRKGPRSIHLARRQRIALPLMAVLLFGGVFGYGGYYAGSIIGPSVLMEDFETELLAQRKEVEAARERAQAEINALTSRLGIMQAQVARLEALGGRLISVSGLDDGEFRFDMTPGLGGPDDTAFSIDADSSSLLGDLDHLSQLLLDREEQFRVLEQIISSRQTELSVMPGGWPVNKGYISSGYGVRNDPFTGRREYHAGIDFVVPTGTDVFALGGGIVKWAGNHHGYGKMLEIDHGNGYVTRYAHNSSLLVTVGEVVRKGQLIAKSGNTGRSTGPHVHLEVIKDGRHVNPARFVQASR